ncbi:MAG: MATE family efflux transporter [Clostridia bacterium]|nr:MATE family efflux transporter [Clostridia bacterium]
MNWFRKYFCDSDFWRITLRLAIPIALQNLLISSFSLIDTLMVGQLGDVALSAVGMAGQWSWMLNIALFGVISGTSLYISQYWGVRDIDGIHRTYGIALTSAVLIATAFALSGLLIPGGIVSIFNRDPAIIDAGSAYLSIAALSYPAVAISNILSTVLRSTERVRLPLAVSGVTAVCNAVLNYTLIFGKFGLPAMGVRGAALATVISSWMGPLLLLLFSSFQKNILITSPARLFRFKRAQVSAFYRRAAPIILNESLWGLGTVIFNVIFSNLGYEYYAAVTIHKTFENIAFVLFVGFCNACCIMVGKSVGAGKVERAVMDSRRFAMIIPFVSLLAGAVIILLRAQLVSVFNMGGNISELTQRTAQTILLIYGLELPMRNIPYIMIVGIFRSGGDTTTGMRLDLFSQWMLSIPATFLAAFVLKLPFVVVYAIMYLFEDYVKSFLCLRHFLSDRWIHPVTEEGKQGYEKYLNGRAHKA